MPGDTLVSRDNVTYLQSINPDLVNQNFMGMASPVISGQYWRIKRLALKCSHNWNDPSSGCAYFTFWYCDPQYFDLANGRFTGFVNVVPGYATFLDSAVLFVNPFNTAFIAGGYDDGSQLVIPEHNIFVIGWANIAADYPTFPITVNIIYDLWQYESSHGSNSYSP